MHKLTIKRKIALGFITFLGLVPLFLLTSCTAQSPSKTPFTSTIDDKNYKYLGGKLVLVNSEGIQQPNPVLDKKRPKEYYSFLFSSLLSTPLLTFIDQFASFQATQPSTLNGRLSEYKYTRVSEPFAIFSNPLNEGKYAITLKLSNVNFTYDGLEKIEAEHTPAKKPDPEKDLSFKVSMSIAGSLNFKFWNTYSLATQDDLTNSNFAEIYKPFYIGTPPSPTTGPTPFTIPITVTSEIKIINKLTVKDSIYSYTGEANLASSNEAPKLNEASQKYFDALTNVLKQRRISVAAFNEAVKFL